MNVSSPGPEDAFLGATDPRAGRLGRILGEATMNLNESRQAVNRAAVEWGPADSGVAVESLGALPRYAPTGPLILTHE
jgi:hypothetical protein